MSKQRLSTLPTDFSINSEDGGGLRLSKNTKIICDVDSFFMIKNENEDTSVITQDERLYSTDPLPKETLPAVRLGNENQDSLDIIPEKDVANVVLPDRTPIEIQPLESKQATLLELPAIEGPNPYLTQAFTPVLLQSSPNDELVFLPDDEYKVLTTLYDDNIDTSLAEEKTSESETITSLNESSQNITSQPSPSNIGVSSSGVKAADYAPTIPYYNFVNAAIASVGASTKSLGKDTEYGNKGCGAGASIIYLRATGHGLKYKNPPQPGKDVNLTYGIIEFVRLIRQDTKNWVQLSNWKDAQPGDLVATISGTVSGHIGWTINEKQSDGTYTIVSNSSKKGYLTKYYSIKKWENQVASRSGTSGTFAFRFKGSFYPPNKTL